MLSSHITHTLDPYHRTNRKSAMRSKGCVLCFLSAKEISVAIVGHVIKLPLLE